MNLLDFMKIILRLKEARPVENCRYMYQGNCLLDESMQFSRLYAVGECMVLGSVEYVVHSVVVENRVQIIGLG